MCEMQMIILLLQTLMINYPLLRKLNCALDMPLAVVFDSIDDIHQFIRLYPFNLVPFTAATKTEKLKSALVDPNEDQVIVLATKGMREGWQMHQLLQILVDSTVTGSIEGEQVCIMPVALFFKALPVEYERLFFTIHVPEVEYTVDALEFLPLGGEIDLVEKNIKEIHASSYRRSLLAAAEFCKLHFLKEDKGLEFQQFQQFVEVIAERHENRRETGEIVESFLRAAFRWRDISHPIFMSIEDLKTVDVLKYRFLIPYDSEFVYLSPEVMKVILTDLSDVYSVDTVRQTLEKEKLLITNRDMDYTVKVSLGGGMRRRFYKFYTLGLEDKNGLPFVQECK